MRSTADSTDLSHLQEIQGTTGGSRLPSDDLLALRAFFLLLDAWDENAAAGGTTAKSNANLPHAV
jgi:hypothetical protein